jgi:hypothetical protein
MRMDCLIVVAAIILAASGAPTVFSLLHRPGVKESALWLRQMSRGR